MNTTERFTIGSNVDGSDGSCGKLTRIVVDPIQRSITHIVVEPHHRRSASRLVPVELVAATVASVRLSCTTAEFDALEAAVETRFLPGASGLWGYQKDHILSWPYYGLELEGVRMGGVGALGVEDGPSAATYDHVPDGDVEVHRGEPVHATDGDIGRVQGLVINRRDHEVTHVLLDEGHLWGEKRVAIPIGAVTTVTDGVTLTLTRDQVRDLPAVGLEPRG